MNIFTPQESPKIKEARRIAAEKKAEAEKLSKPSSLAKETLSNIRKFLFPTRKEIVDEIQQEKRQTLLPSVSKRLAREREASSGLMRLESSKSPIGEGPLYDPTGIVGSLKRVGVTAAKKIASEVVENIAQTKAPSVISILLKKLGIGGDDVVSLSKTLAQTEKPSEVARILGNAKQVADTIPPSLTKSTGNTQAAESIAEPLLPSTPLKIDTIADKVNSSLPENIPTQDESVKKVIDALSEAKPVRKAQEKIYTQERGAKIAKVLEVGKNTSGEKGFYAELGALKGEMTKVEFNSIRQKVSQVDIDNVFNKVKDSPVLNEWDKIAARRGLGKLFGEFGGQVPTEGEIFLLEKSLGKDFVESVLEKRTLWTKVKDAGLELANIPRSVMASFDLSAPLRQGVFMVGRKQFYTSWDDMFKAFASEKSFKEVQESVMRMKTHELAKDSGLALGELDSVLTKREEQFMSGWAEKIPVAGKLIRASGRAYTAFLNKLRADVFEDLVTKADALGRNTPKDPGLMKEIAKYVNAATGRGSLGSLEKAAPALNAFFFSPRLMASRLTLLNPNFYIKADPFVRKEALKDLLRFGGTALTVLGLADAAGADVGTNPTSADFGKIKIGSTRIDIGGGFQQYLRMGAQLISGKYTSTQSGKEFTLGEGYKPVTRLDILQRQVESKEAPIFSFITTLLRGQDGAGEKINVGDEIKSRFVPMIAQDMLEIAKRDPRLLPLGIPAIFGVSVQDYGAKKKTRNVSGNPFSPQ